MSQQIDWATVINVTLITLVIVVLLSGCMTIHDLGDM